MDGPTSTGEAARRDLFTASQVGDLIAAVAFAAERHRDQRRKGEDHRPYVNHVIGVMQLLWDVGGVRDTATLVAALLHDTVEDTGTAPEEIEARFGPEVASIVREVTDDKSLPKDVRKQLQIVHAADASRAAKLVKLADKISQRAGTQHGPACALARVADRRSTSTGRSRSWTGSGAPTPRSRRPSTPPFARRGRPCSARRTRILPAPALVPPSRGRPLSESDSRGRGQIL